MKVKILKKVFLCLSVFFLGADVMYSQTLQRYISHPDSMFYRSSEALRIGDQIVLWQRETGGWPKNTDMVAPMSDSLKNEVVGQKMRRNDSTTDNGATYQQLFFLAHLYRNTHEARFRLSFLKGVDYLLEGQYANGGWPQFWPERRGYQWHITYNDDAMVNTLCLIRDISNGKEPFDGNLTDKKLRKRLKKAFDKGIECILATQIVADGKPTVWCQQHDHETLLPAPARAYELPSYCPIESAMIIKLLMEIPHPDDKVKRSVTGAMEWLDRHKLQGIRVEQYRNSEGQRDVRVVPDETAPAVWARFYDLEHVKPFFCDRDGVPKAELSQIGYERRTGYSWYNARPAQLFPIFEKWKKLNGVVL